MSTLYFIRHGQASFGKENYDRLSERGIRQSGLLGEYLASRNIAFDAVYTGMLARHAGTEEAVRRAYASRGMGLPESTRREGLNEYDSREILEALVPELLREDGSYQDDVARLFTDRKSFQRVFEAAMLRWASGRYEANIVNWTDFVYSVNSCTDEIMSRDGRGRTVAVISSGGPVSVTVRRALGLTDGNTMRVTWQIKNSSITRFKCTRDDIMLESFNEVPHLEAAGEEGLITYR
jgi:broad specificity phosphatase PhoE